MLHFCLDDGPRVLDRIEFDDKLRWLDGLDDAAFLAMDLEALGAVELGRRFLDWYAEFAADPAPNSLRHHYLVYRASWPRGAAAGRNRSAGAEHGAIGPYMRDRVPFRRLIARREAVLGKTGSRYRRPLGRLIAGGPTHDLPV